MSRPWLLALFPIALIGCLAPAPPAVAERGGLLVRAPDEATATLVADLAEPVAALVRAELRGSTDAPVEIWVQDDLALYSMPGSGSGSESFFFHLLQRIHVSRASMVGPPGKASATLAHELVHMLRDDVWARLDGPLEEGLADVLACRVAPGGAGRVRSQRYLAALDPAGGLQIRVSFADGSSSLSATLRPSPAEGGFLEEALSGSEVDTYGYGRGFLVVEQLAEAGRLPELRAACLAATEEDAVSLQAAARLAGFDIEPPALTAWVLQHMDDAMFRFALTTATGQIGYWLASGRLAGSGDPAVDFERLAPSFTVDGGTARVAGADVPGLLDAIAESREQIARQRAARP